jgi:FMN-dependent NADH-azoreductase
MNQVLRVTTSIVGANSVSSALMEELLEGFRARGERFQLVDRDFSKGAIPHMDGTWLQALATAEVERNEEQQAQVDFSDRLIAEVQAADTLVIALPMYNFAVPSMLKAWLDHIARAGVTFTYTESGPQGLLTGKKVFLVTAMGGLHVEGESDFVRPYMRQIMGFLGLDDVTIITASGLNMGDEARTAGLAAARTRIQELTGSADSKRQRAQEAA